MLGQEFLDYMRDGMTVSVAADGTVTVESLHAPLVSVGSRNLYNLDDKIESMEDGFYFNLFNNRWGTNFKMWCSDDCLFDFVIRIETNPQI